MNQDQFSPVALFVFARPDHTRRTLQALSRNHLADKTKLYIFADGARENATEETHQGIKEVRKLIRERNWCGDVKIIESEVNKGLADSIIGGVRLVTEQHGRAIILEDDLETSPGFLKYMNDALNTYANDDRVMQVSGFNVKTSRWTTKTGFLRVSTSWGWATWDRAWRLYDNDAHTLLERVRPRREEFDLDGHSFHFEELERNVTGDLKTWAVRWYASIFLNNGLCLYPKKSLVRNLGFDGSGENCKGTSREMLKMSTARSITMHRIPITESPLYLAGMQRYFTRTLREWTHTRLRDRIWNRLKRAFR